MPNNEIKFDELDNKFFEEFPLIVDLFTSTINKVAHFLGSYHRDLLVFAEQEITKHSGWSISNKETYAKRHIPFTNEWKRKFSMEESLVARYEVFNSIEIVKENEKKVSNYFTLNIGFCYNPDWDEKNFIYFEIVKNDEKLGGQMNSLSFYETLLNEKFEIEIHHYDNDYDEEDFFIKVYKLDMIEIAEAYNYYKECLTKFFTNINW